MSEQRLQELVQRWQQARARGDPPSSEELCRDCPELLPELRQRLDACLNEKAPASPPRLNALLLDPTGRADAEQIDTLRRRLRLVTFIFLTQWALFFAIVSGRDERLESPVMAGVEIVLFSGAAALLTFRRNWTPLTLRFLEAILFGMIVARITIGQAIFLSGTDVFDSGDELKIVVLTDALMIPWLLLILVYAVFVPNTALRSAVVVVATALVPVCLLGWFASRSASMSDEVRRHCMKRMTTHLVVAGAIAIFNSYGIDRLRREVRAAKQLGQYVLKRRLGQGGMGEVYLAEHQLLRRLCAVKLIRSDKAASTLVQSRFEREAKVMANLRHPNIVDVFDYGVTPDGTFFYVMEHLSGPTLAELVEDSGPLPPARAIALLCQVAAAVGAAHQCGLIHRDIKPSNMILIDEPGGAGTVKLLDFGLVHLEDARPLTEDGRLLGTPAFMSPEQIAGTHSLDARSDIYSIGVLACFLLTGRNPFDRPEARQVFAAHLHDEVPALNLPAGNADLEAVVRRCLAKDPADRFADAESLDRALAACAAGL